MTGGFGTKFFIQWTHGHGHGPRPPEWQHDFPYAKNFNTIEEARNYITQAKVPVIGKLKK